MTNTVTFTPASTSSGTAGRTRRPVSQVSIAAGAVALVVIEAYGAIARAAGVPLRAAAFGAHTATQVNAGWLAFGVVLGTFWGTVLAVVFARHAARPARAFLVTTLPLLALSLTGPLTADATTATKVTLACGHLIAAAIIIPAVTRRLAVAHRMR
jgi:putative copper export protein